jgi:succinate dehydrogenase / fumarate reductase cytochrome b subunit
MNINRPISPHLTVYNLGFTSILSIIHRITGVALSVTLCVFVIVLKMISFHLSSYNIYAIAYYANNFSGILFSLVGLFLIFCIVYHFIAGIRHLVWDTEFGLDMPKINLSMYILLGFATIGTLSIWMLF